MDSEEWIRDRLLESPELLKLAGGRICPGRLPQRSAQAFVDGISYARMQTAFAHDMDGPSGSINTYTELRCWSTDYRLAKRMARLARPLVACQAADLAGLSIQSSFVENEYDEEYASAEAKDQLIFARVLVVNVAVVDESLDAPPTEN